MVWLKALRNETVSTPDARFEALHDVKFKFGPDKYETIYTRNISALSVTPRQHPQSLPFATPDTLDADLPFVKATAIQQQPKHKNHQGCTTSSLSNDELYTVIENIVYDCTQFVHEHPGGAQVIESFCGQDCTWQFWRFHSRDVMQKWGRS